MTATADQGARQTIRRLARVNPAARVVATGCYATRDPDALADLPSVVRVVSNECKAGVGASIAQLLGLTTAERFGAGDGPCGGTLEPGVAGRTALTVCVQTGCDEACSYCIIPRTRGRAKLWVPEAVSAVQRAAEAGFREVVLTGVHLGSYGRDLPGGSSLVDLVEASNGRRRDVLLRIGSLEPMDFTPDLVAMVTSSHRFAPHFHLPLQHASDAVLWAMRRPYTRPCTELVGEIATSLPDAVSAPT